MDQKSAAADAEALPRALERKRRRRRRGVRRKPLASPRSLHLFGRDLRLSDNAALAEAARSGEVVAAHVVETRLLERAARNPRRAAYYCSAVGSLAADLAVRDARLLMCDDPSAEAIARLARTCGATIVTWGSAYDAATLAQQRALRAELVARGFDVRVVHDAPAVPPEETAAAHSEDGSRGYRALAPYLAAWASQPREPIATAVVFARTPPTSTPLPTLPAASDGNFADAEPHTERAALAALDAYLAGPVMSYPIARDVPGGAPTARLSAALSFGLISARTVCARIDARARDPFLLTEERLALAAFAHALARRDFFLQLAWFYEDAPDRPLQSSMGDFILPTSHPALEAWRAGATGYPLVDAGMRQLRATGWMHPRARLVAASFLCFDLGLDWRVGRDAWDDELVEDDAALASGNWQWIAGVGADLAQFPRIYNPRKQARAFDPLGTYVKRYVPELSDALPATVRSRADGPMQLGLDLYDAVPYPAPVVDHEIAARAFLARYVTYRGGRSGARRDA